MFTKEQQFTELYETYADRILKLCKGFTANHSLAEDLMQETFVHVWQSLDKFRGASKHSTWMYRIAMNTCMGYFRSPKNKSSVELSIQLADIPEEKNNIEQQVQQLYNCIHELQETDRLIITMVLEDLPYAEIAEISGISEGNLRVKIHRIKSQLTQIMKRYEQL